jgi:hypothetical protein
MLINEIFLFKSCSVPIVLRLHHGGRSQSCSMQRLTDHRRQSERPAPIYIVVGYSFVDGRMGGSMRKMLLPAKFDKRHDYLFVIALWT